MNESKGSFTSEMLMEATTLMKQHAVPPCVIITTKEAQEFTENDPLGKTWQVGDEYYELRSIDKRIAVKP